MALARWKDLCIDACDAARVGAFWRDVLGLDLELHHDGDAVLRGPASTDTIWVNRVPERKTVKQRVHLDLEAVALEPIVELGATVVLPAEASGFPWSVLHDPEGGEFCVFLRDAVATAAPARRHGLVVDTSDSESSETIAGWWAGVLGGRLVDDGRGFWWVADVAGLPFDTVDFVPVPERKRVKNRIHWDIESDDLDELVARGATVLAQPTEATPWHVCADPDGNEFCMFRPH